MPKGKRSTDGRYTPVRLSAIESDRLDQLMDLHGETQSNILRDALTLKWYVDIGFKKLTDIDLLKREADILTNYGQDDPSEDTNG